MYRTVTAFALVLFAAFAVAQDAPLIGRQLVPPHAPYVHGGLADVPFIVTGDGITLPSSRYAFLSVRLDPVPSTPTVVEYEQEVGYFVAPDGAIIRTGATISRVISTAEADGEGWVLLPLSKPCKPGEASVLVGYVTVCPPRADGESRLWACTNPANGIAPIYAGAPAEPVRCAQGKRRAARH